MSAPRLPSKRSREIARLLAAQGWTYTGVTGSDHLRFRHRTGRLLITSSTPSDRHAQARVLAEARRRLRAAP